MVVERASAVVGLDGTGGLSEARTGIAVAAAGRGNGRGAAVWIALVLATSRNFNKDG